MGLFGLMSFFLEGSGEGLLSNLWITDTRREELRLIDLHCHILPGLDDGPVSVDESIEMCLASHRSGVRKIVASPHFLGRWKVIKERVFRGVEELNARLSDLGLDPPLEVIVGGEVYAGEDLLKAVEEGRVLTVANGGKYILVEFPFRGVPLGMEEVLFQLLVRGIVPIICHPEKISDFWDNPDRYFRMVRLGCLGQLTASSMRKFRDFSEELLRRGLVHFLASDGHDAKGVSGSVFSDGLSRVGEIIGKEGALRMVKENPLAVLEGRYLEVEDPIPF